MIKSMTGFGKGEVALPNKKIVVEIRSLNSKQLDLSVKIPALYRQAEHEIRNRIGKTLLRGKVDVYVSIETTSVEMSAHINREVFREYLRQMTDALTYSGIDADYGDIMQCVMRLPDVVSTDSNVVGDEELSALMLAIDEAVLHIDEFRQQEGAILEADLLKRISEIESYKEQVEPYEQARTEAIRQRIRESIAKIGIDVDSNRLEQEMIYYIEKLDINEEKVRLKQHCDYFREVARNEDNAGRKLGFIAQEMGREINTLGSKSNEANMQILVVKMKDELEKIKEQVLNIL